MFEDSLVESQNRLSSKTQRWTTLASLSLQASLIVVAAGAPLLHPEVLPFRLAERPITLPSKPPIPQVPRVAAHDDQNSSRAVSLLIPSAISNFHRVQTIALASEDIPPETSSGTMGTNDLPGTLVSGLTSTPSRASLAPAHTIGPARISSGVLAGLLLTPIQPVYPPMAIRTRTEGVVVIDAIISRTGQIESAHVTSGPALLRAAALEAVRQAHYSPFLLNGTATEVETTITVNFRLGA